MLQFCILNALHKVKAIVLLANFPFITYECLMEVELLLCYAILSRAADFN